jgi:hypothetical protein
MFFSYRTITATSSFSRTDTPTIALVVPMKYERRTGFSASAVAKAMADKMNASQMEAKFAYLKLNRQTPSVFAQSYGLTGARLVALSWSTEERFGEVFHSNLSGSPSVKAATIPTMSDTIELELIGRQGFHWTLA